MARETNVANVQSAFWKQGNVRNSRKSNLLPRRKFWFELHQEKTINTLNAFCKVRVKKRPLWSSDYRGYIMYFNRLLNTRTNGKGAQNLTFSCVVDVSLFYQNLGLISHKMSCNLIFDRDNIKIIHAKPSSSVISSSSSSSLTSSLSSFRWLSCIFLLSARLTFIFACSCSLRSKSLVPGNERHITT